MARGKDKGTNPELLEEAAKGVVRVKVLPEDVEHSDSGIWEGFKNWLNKLLRKAVDAELAESAIDSAKSKLDEQSYKNEHVAAQIENELAETRLRHSEADKSSSFLHAERRVLDAQAEKTEAEAAKIRAETQSVNLENQLKILDKFSESGMKFAPVLDEDGYVVGVTVTGIESDKLPGSQGHDTISEDAKLELLSHLRRAQGQRVKPATGAAPRRVTLKRKSQSELRLSGNQGRSRTPVKVRRKPIYMKRDVLEKQARDERDEQDATDAEIEQQKPDKK